MNRYMSFGETSQTERRTKLGHITTKAGCLGDAVVDRFLARVNAKLMLCLSARASRGTTVQSSRPVSINEIEDSDIDVTGQM